MASEVVQDAEMDRFELLVDGVQAGIAEYRIAGGTMTIHHTEVDPEFRGQGRGDELTRGTLNLVRAETDYRVVAECPYTKKWIDEHADYQDLLTR